MNPLYWKSDWRWWRAVSCWIQLRVLRRPVAFDPRKTLEPWEEAHAAELASALGMPRKEDAE